LIEGNNGVVIDFDEQDRAWVAFSRTTPHFNPLEPQAARQHPGASAAQGFLPVDQLLSNALLSISTT
jgi:hypothetical protein